MRRLYQLARQTTRGFESYARRLQKRYHNCPKLLEDVVDGLFYVAISDGVVTGDELIYLERVSQLFGQSPLIFRRLKATHLGPEAGDPYAVLGVRHDVLRRRAFAPPGGPCSRKRTPTGRGLAGCRPSSSRSRTRPRSG